MSWEKFYIAMGWKVPEWAIPDEDEEEEIEDFLSNCNNDQFEKLVYLKS